MFSLAAEHRTARNFQAQSSALLHRIASRPRPLIEISTNWPHKFGSGSLTAFGSKFAIPQPATPASAPETEAAAATLVVAAEFKVGEEEEEEEN